VVVFAGKDLRERDVAIYEHRRTGARLFAPARTKQEVNTFRALTDLVAGVGGARGPASLSCGLFMRDMPQMRSHQIVEEECFPLPTVRATGQVSYVELTAAERPPDVMRLLLTVARGLRKEAIPGLVADTTADGRKALCQMVDFLVARAPAEYLPETHQRPQLGEIPFDRYAITVQRVLTCKPQPNCYDKERPYTQLKAYYPCATLAFDSSNNLVVRSPSRPDDFTDVADLEQVVRAGTSRIHGLQQEERLKWAREFVRRQSVSLAPLFNRYLMLNAGSLPAHVRDGLFLSALGGDAPLSMDCDNVGAIGGMASAFSSSDVDRWQGVEKPVDVGSPPSSVVVSQAAEQALALDPILRDNLHFFVGEVSLVVSLQAVEGDMAGVCLAGFVGDVNLRFRRIFQVVGSLRPGDSLRERFGVVDAPVEVLLTQEPAQVIFVTEKGVVCPFAAAVNPSRDFPVINRLPWRMTIDESTFDLFGWQDNVECVVDTLLAEADRGVYPKLTIKGLTRMECSELTVGANKYVLAPSTTIDKVRMDMGMVTLMCGAHLELPALSFLEDQAKQLAAYISPFWSWGDRLTYHSLVLPIQGRDDKFAFEGTEVWRGDGLWAVNDDAIEFGEVRRPYYMRVDAPTAAVEVGEDWEVFHEERLRAMGIIFLPEMKIMGVCFGFDVCLGRVDGKVAVGVRLRGVALNELEERCAHIAKQMARTVDHLYFVATVVDRIRIMALDRIVIGLLRAILQPITLWRMGLPASGDLVHESVCLRSTTVAPVVWVPRTGDGGGALLEGCWQVPLPALKVSAAVRFMRKIRGVHSGSQLRIVTEPGVGKARFFAEFFGPSLSASRCDAVRVALAVSAGAIEMVCATDGVLRLELRDLESLAAWVRGSF
jgi:hypothetical protein